MLSPKQTIRVGMIGCGGNARGHMRRLLGIDNVEIVAVSDVAEAAIQATRELDPRLEDVPVFSDYAQMLREAELDAVEISTPHTLHFEQIMAALDAGLNVLCEKPMVCAIADAKSVAARAEQSGLVVGVSYQRHTQAPYRYCREVIASGDVGECYFVTCWQSQNWYRRQVGGSTWRSKQEWSGGGQLNDSGSHLVDIVLWMTGLRPREVFAYQENLEAEVDILSAISVEFDSGALCNFSVVGHAVNFHEEITLFCDECTLGIRGPEVWRWNDETKQVISGEELGRSWDPDTNFIAALRGQEPVQATVADAVQVARLSEAVWESAATGQPVRPAD